MVSYDSGSSSEIVPTTTHLARSVTSGGSSNVGYKASTTTLMSYLGSESSNLLNAISQRPWVGAQPAASSTSQTRVNHKEEPARSSEQKSSSRQYPQTRETDAEHTDEADTDYVASWAEGYRDEAGGGISSQPQTWIGESSHPICRESISTAPQPASPLQGSPSRVFFVCLYTNTSNQYP